jgi:radical SAM superfamily enzyme YgiQ (UPF0313 family)
MRHWQQEGVDKYYFVDSTFNLPVWYAKDLCQRLIAASLGVSWTSIVYPFHFDEELARLMADAGCVEAAVGFESGCNHMLGTMRKRFTTQDVKETCSLLRNAGIRRTGFLLLGGPGETRDSVQESLAFADSLELDVIVITAGIRIYPDTALADIARKEGVVAKNDDLLLPRFYLSGEVKDWITDRTAEYSRRHPNGMVYKR